MSREDWEKRNPGRDYPENLAEIIFAKHRNGPVHTVKLHFQKDLMKFYDLEAEREFSGLGMDVGADLHS